MIVSSRSQINIRSIWLSGSGDNCWVLFRIRLVFDFDDDDVEQCLPSVLIEGDGEFDELGFERSRTSSDILRKNFVHNDYLPITDGGITSVEYPWEVFITDDGLRLYDDA